MAEFVSSFNFEVILAPSGRGGDEGLAATASFSEVSGLELSIEATALREGGYNAGVRQLIGRTTSPPLVLKRGVTADRAFWSWIQRCFSGRYPLPYVNGEVRIYAPGGDRSAAVARWSFVNGIATRVRSADLSAANASAVPIEELHLAVEGLTREAP